MFHRLRTIAITYQAFLLETAAAVTLSGGFLLLLWYVQRTIWKDFLFMNADMLTLSLLWESLRISEPFHWVFSSQVFIFPEFILYAVSALLSPNLHSTILVNAFINIILLYLGVRFILYTLNVKPHIARLYGLGYSFIVLLCMMLEQRLYPLTMYYLVTTAYYGVIVAGLFVIGLSLLLIRMLRQKKLKFSYFIAGSIILINLLTSTANPMFLLQVSAPLCIVALLLLIFRTINWRTLLWLLLPHITAALGSILLRKTFFSGLLSPMGEINNYLHLENFIAAMRQYKTMLLQLASGSWQGQLELLIILASMSFAIAFLVLALFGSRLLQRLNVSLREEQLFLIAFASLAPLATFFGTILTGNAITRYLLPLAFLPMLTFIPLTNLIRQLQKTERRANITLAAGCGLIVFMVLLTQAWQAPRALAAYYPQDVACLDNSLRGTSYKNGIAQFWRARSMQLNSQNGHKVLQVTGDLKPFQWLYNQAAYQLYDASFVVVDTFVSLESSGYEISGEDNFTIDPGSTIVILGQPSHIYHCKSFDIYTYDKGSPAQNTLSQRLKQQY